ncbi:hypothetical protein [Croceivirga thetidis]|uniref:Uncharacterized protein n=1 Tax=Croceivirga thetidis TaxID=2721623 RepID=A0ABX1GU72_9FLAO|nr:hypothetical protein [Croceivirga thetidis]NKI33463.1 hypothetical protein [Croceivirga thetidis]
MSEDYNSSDFKKLLDKLQTESWQLELLISGFAIFGLFQAKDPLEVELIKAIGNNEEIYGYLIRTVYPALTILLIVLLIHVILRGVWIGALGLRYVSGDIDYEHLNYSKKFTDRLTQKVGSFDRYISRLENICSTLFAIAFLMAFYFMAYMLVVGFFATTTSLVEITGIFSKDQQIQFTAAWGLIYFSMALLVFVDFIGMGVLKKGNLRPKIYMPIYRFFGIITLSFLYRPLVYNFLDQKRAKWLATFILPAYILGSVLVSSFKKQQSNYLGENPESSTIYASTSNYEDVIDENDELVDFAVIPSKVITTPYLPLKVPYTSFKEDAVFKQDSTLNPEKDRRGYRFNARKIDLFGAQFQFNNGPNDFEEQKKYLKVFNNMYKIMIDSTVIEKEFIYTTNENERLQFETFLDISHLENGKHLLYVVGPRGQTAFFEQKIINDTIVTIPFWYFKN